MELVIGSTHLPPVLKDQLDVAAVPGEERWSGGSTSVALVHRLLLCCHVQLCDAREGILITQVLYCWGQVPETRSFESNSVFKVVFITSEGGRARDR